MGLFILKLGLALVFKKAYCRGSKYIFFFNLDNGALRLMGTWGQVILDIALVFEITQIRLSNLVKKLKNHERFKKRKFNFDFLTFNAHLVSL